MITSAIHTTCLISNDRAIQATSYYPYGLPMAESSFPDANRNKYSAKELVTHRGYDAYDFGPRNQLPTLCIFDNPDLLQEKFYGLHSSSYCAANPIRNIDPTGMEFVDQAAADRLKGEINKRIKRLDKTIDKQVSKLKEHKFRIKDLYKIVDNIEQRKELNNSLNDIEKLEKDVNKYDFYNIDSQRGHHVRMGENGIIYIETYSNAISIHEIRHIRQSLDGNCLKFKNNYLQPARPNNVNNLNPAACSLYAERDAYRAQYAFSNSSLPQTVGSLSEIDYNFVANLYKPEVGYLYEEAHDFYESTRGDSNPNLDPYIQRPPCRVVIPPEIRERLLHR